LIGALIMTHSDDNGLVLPPNLAPIQVVLVPIYRGEEELQATAAACHALAKDLRAKGLRVKVDDRDTHKPGWKFAEYEMKGVPVRIAIGPKDLEKGTVEVARRDTLTKSFEPMNTVVDHVVGLMHEIQQSLFNRARDFRDANTHTINTWDAFVAALETGGFVRAHWDGTAETEEKIKEQTKATIRCIPLNEPEEAGQCILTGKPSPRRVLFAKAY
jgi:prolyl-tRNA synthetase